MPSLISRVAVLCIVLLCFLGFARSSPVDYRQDEYNMLEERQQTAPENCSTGIHVIVGPGKGAAMKNGLSQTLINKVKNKYPGSNARTIHYDMTAHPIPEARPRYVRYVKNYARDCPNTPVFLFGYSAGGIIVMDTLCGNSENIGPPSQPISPMYTGNVIAAIVYGDETWRANQTYDSTDSRICKNDAPEFARPDTAACMPSASKIRSYCNGDDGDCCANAIGAPQAHKAYPMDYDNDALNFVSSKYDAFRLSHPLSSVLSAAPINVAPLAVANGFGPLQ